MPFVWTSFPEEPAALSVGPSIAPWSRFLQDQGRWFPLSRGVRETRREHGPRIPSAPVPALPASALGGDWFSWSWGLPSRPLSAAQGGGRSQGPQPGTLPAATAQTSRACFLLPPRGGDRASPISKPSFSQTGSNKSGLRRFRKSLQRESARSSFLQPTGFAVKHGVVVHLQMAGQTQQQ